GCAPGVLAEAAVDLSRAHMALIAAATVLPPAHAELLAALRPRYRLGLVSNFDDTGAAYDILGRHGIARSLDTVVISEGVGLRKPHPAVARAGLRGLGLAAGEVLLVGDTWGEDVAGARAAGLEAAWIDAAGHGVAQGADPPRSVLRALPELAAPRGEGPPLAAAGAVLVCGGLGGVMEAAARGAAEGGGTVIGILPGYDHRDANRHLTVALPTGLGYARNVLVAAAGDALIALPGGHGTLSEVALAQVLGRPVVALGRRRERAGVVAARTPAEAVRRALALARRRHSR